MEGVRFADVGDLVLDVGQKSTIQLLVEGGITPLDMGGKVLHDVLVIAHLGIFEVSLSLAFEIMGSEVIF